MPDIYSETTAERRKCVTIQYDPPPIPNAEHMAWYAITGDYDEGRRIGYGETEGAALYDLLGQCMEDVGEFGHEMIDAFEAWILHSMAEKMDKMKADTVMKYSERDLRLYKLGYIAALAECLGVLE